MRGAEQEDGVWLVLAGDQGRRLGPAQHDEYKEEISTEVMHGWRCCRGVTVARGE